MGEAGKWLNGDPSNITNMVFDPLLAGFSGTAPPERDTSGPVPTQSPAWSISGAFELRREALTRALVADNVPEESEVVAMADNALTMCVALQSRVNSLDACLRQLDDPARVQQLNLTQEEADKLGDIGEAESGQLRVALEEVLDDSARLVIRLDGFDSAAGGLGEDVVKAYVRDICCRVLTEPTPSAGEANGTPWHDICSAVGDDLQEQTAEVWVEEMGLHVQSADVVSLASSAKSCISGFSAQLVDVNAFAEWREACKAKKIAKPRGRDAPRGYSGARPRHGTSGPRGRDGLSPLPD